MAEFSVGERVNVGNGEVEHEVVAVLPVRAGVVYDLIARTGGRAGERRQGVWEQELRKAGEQ